MLQYLVILLDNTSPSYCHYENLYTKNSLIRLEDLKAGILFAMKENLRIQFVYPDETLPCEYKEIIKQVDHIDIVSSQCKDTVLKTNADIMVFHGWTGVGSDSFNENQIYVLKTSKADLFANANSLKPILERTKRLNIIIDDIPSFNNEDFEQYKTILSALSDEIEALYAKGETPQLNLLTDRIILDEMNNCNAGWKSIALAPDGKFYVCPAFYNQAKIDGSEVSIGDLCEKGFDIGDLQTGIHIKNPQLYRLDHAPLCRNCDAFQCKRCIWLNRTTTYEINTPSHEQCTIAHIERNASRELLNKIRQHGSFLPDKEIKEITYLDPFNVKETW